MNLSRSMAYRIGGLTCGLLVLAVVPLYALQQIRQGMHHAYDEYKELRIVDEMAVHIGAAQGLIQAGKLDLKAIDRELEQAVVKVGTFLEYQGSQERDAPEHEDAEYQTAILAGNAIENVRTHLATTQGGIPRPERREAVVGELASAKDALDELAGHMSTEIVANYESLLARLRMSVVMTAALALTIVVTTILLNTSLYRSVIRPLRQLRQGVRTITAGRFSERLALTGHGEFSEVADDFNRMTSELDNLYRDLEQKVRVKSRELVRSERLASVGFLAAGVAHEINNPLNVISGYAELSLRRLEQDAAGRPRGTNGRVAETRKALEIIRDESFRCKEITEKLLSLSRQGSDDQQPVDLGKVAEEVIAMVQGLKPYRDRRIRLGGTDGHCGVARANATELKQVLLNLILNALEATDPAHGLIEVEIEEADEVLRVVVRDNGRGMTPEVLEHVFEPFYTDRRGISPPGTGLGLTIAHAVVESHGGRLWAESEGVGRGSRFVMELPRGTGGDHG